MLVSFIALLILLLGGYLFFQSQSENKISREAPTVRDFAKEVLEDEIYASAKKYTAAGEDTKSLEALMALKEKYKGQPEESVVDNIIGEKNFSMGKRAESAQIYAKIYHNAEYVSVSRAFAILATMLNARGIQDPTLLKPFFTGEEFARYQKAGTLELEASRKIYALWPFAIAAEKIAREEIGKLESTLNSTPKTNDAGKNVLPQALVDGVEKIIAKFGDDLAANIRVLEASSGMTSLIPSTHMAAARLYADVDLRGYTLLGIGGKPVGELASASFTSAIARARSMNMEPPEQFAMLAFANYLAMKKDFTQAAEVIDALSKKTVNKWVLENLRAKDAKLRYVGLTALMKEQPSITYFKQFGW